MRVTKSFVHGIWFFEIGLCVKTLKDTLLCTYGGASDDQQFVNFFNEIAQEPAKKNMHYG